MGQPVVHFEVVGQDGSKLQSSYSELFGSVDFTVPRLNEFMLRHMPFRPPERTPKSAGS